MLVLEVTLSVGQYEMFKATLKGRNRMENVAVRETKTAKESAAHVEEEYSSHSWLEDYLERLEAKEAREEYYTSYEYCALMATLLA